MKAARFAAGMLLFAIPLWSAAAPPLTLVGYQMADGEITLQRNGTIIDPYFSTKAVLLAAQQGMDVEPVAQRWIRWLLPRQLPDGRFMRFCRPAPEQAWAACHDADADDAMMAMWLALLAETAQGALSPELLQSAERALTQLEQLRAPDSGVYYISATSKVALLMDNVEIYEAYRTLARYFKQRGDRLKTKMYTARATAVAAAIERVFWLPAQQRYRVTTQARQADNFYPDRVAQIYPMLGRLPDTRHDYAVTYKAWMRANRDDWLAFRADHFPWGLVAIVAQRIGDTGPAHCWASAAEPLRNGPRWNVLEEAALEALRANHVKQVKGQSC
jgi:hypothetical protein